jgi:hypothetical protein
MGSVARIRRGLHNSVPVVIERFTFLDRNANRDLALTWKEAVYQPGTLEILPCELRYLEQSWEYCRRDGGTLENRLGRCHSRMSAPPPEGEKMLLKDQLRKRPVAGAVAIVAFFILQSLLTIFSETIFGPVKCNDGYASQSIGRSGACSSHGGVDKSRDALIALLSAAGAGAIFLWCAPIGRAPPPPIGSETPPPALRRKRGVGPRRGGC